MKNEELVLPIVKYYPQQTKHQLFYKESLIDFFLQK